MCVFIYTITSFKMHMIIKDLQNVIGFSINFSSEIEGQNFSQNLEKFNSLETHQNNLVK